MMIYMIFSDWVTDTAKLLGTDTNCGTPKQKEEISAFIEDGVELPGVGDVLYNTSTPPAAWILILVARQNHTSCVSEVRWPPFLGLPNKLKFSVLVSHTTHNDLVQLGEGPTPHLTHGGRAPR